MDPVTASYYRSILFRDSQDQRPLPPRLVLLHAWAFKRFQHMGCGSLISKQAALSVAMTWLSSTKEGREFANEFTEIGHLFTEPENALLAAGETVHEDVDWDSVPLETKVIATVGEKTQIGEFIGRRSSWIDVRIGGERKSFRHHQVRVASSGA